MASNIIGGYDLNWLEAPSQELKCLICLSVARDPQQHGDEGCGKMFCESCISEHQKESTNCPHCRENLTLFTDVRSAQQIKLLKINCDNRENGCVWTGELGNLTTHLRSCDYPLLPCINECIINNEIATFLPKDLEDHLTNNCPRRQYECPHCQETGEHEERTTIHLETCSKVEVPCSNLRCRDKFPRCEIITHQSMCEYEPVSCKYAKVGCKTTPLRINLSKHEKNDKVHLRVTAEKVLELTSFVSRSNTVPRTIRLPNYLKHKSDKDQFYSPPFYTSYNGYKMCVRVDANGNGAGEGTHVSVYAYLMKGDNDDSLSWPFTGRVTLELLNQLEDRNHHKVTIPFPADSKSSQRVVEHERASLGYGRPKFISHADLDYNACENTQYLKDDTLVFRVSVQVPDYKPWLQ